ncbi:MAG: glycosyltransferase [Candidatus Hydrogenedentota bacterium]
MRVLAMGHPMWGDQNHLADYHCLSQRGHTVRTLAPETGDGDVFFAPEETAAEVVARVSREWPVDLLLCGCPEMYPPPHAIEACPVKTAAVISDWNLHQPQLAHNLARFDLVLSDRPGAQMLNVKGATPTYLQPVYSHMPRVHRDLGLDRNIDVLFLGSRNHAIHRARGRALEAAAALAGRYRIHIGGERPAAEYAAYMNRARIVLNHSLRGEMNLRCFETIACGALLFLEADNLEAGDWLVPETQYVPYTQKNLCERLMYFLDHEPERARIARAGHARADALAMARRLDDFFDWMQAQPREPRNFAGFTDETRTLAEILLYANGPLAAQHAHARNVAQAAVSRFDTSATALAAGAMALDRANDAARQDRTTHVKESLAHFHAATRHAPGEAVAWLNLAYVARQLGARDVERKCLTQAVETPGIALGAWLLGHVTDPYFVDWRRALAEGTADAAILHAAAGTRRAAMALEDGDAASALALAETSIARWPRVPTPYRIGGKAALETGNAARAIDLLEPGLEYTAFDAPHRETLYTAYIAAGETETARAFAEETARIFATRPDMQDEARTFAARGRGENRP